MVSSLSKRQAASWKGSTSFYETFLIWRNCVITTDCKGLAYGHSRCAATELIYWRCLNWRLGYLTYPCKTFFELSVDSRTRGHSWKILKNRSKLDIRKFFFSERVVNRWDSLSQDDVDQTSLNIFKRVLERRRKAEMGFFMDWSSAESLWSHLLLPNWCGHTR